MASKGIIILLEVIPSILAKFSNIVFHIAGRPMSDYIMSEKKISQIVKAKINNINLYYSGKLKYHGFTTGDDKQRLLEEADIFILPTFHKTESQPISIIEAMISRCAIITTNHNYLTELTDEQGGIFITPGSVQELKQAIKLLLNDKLLLDSMKKYNVQIAKKKYSPDNYVRKLSNLILH